MTTKKSNSTNYKTTLINDGLWENKKEQIMRKKQFDVGYYFKHTKRWPSKEKRELNENDEEEETMFDKTSSKFFGW